MAYFTQKDIESSLKRTLSPAEVDALVVVLPAITSYIEGQTDRVFEVDAEAADVTMQYFGQMDDELDIDDFVSITKVEAYNRQGTLIKEVTDFEAIPLNKPYKNCLISLAGCWADYKYKVTGKLGYSMTVPADIKMVAIRLAARAIDDLNADIQKGKSFEESIEGYSYKIGNAVTSDSLVEEVLGKYRKVML